LDTGASANFITRALLETLANRGHVFQVTKVADEGSHSEVGSVKKMTVQHDSSAEYDFHKFRTMDGVEMVVEDCVRLTIFTGVNNTPSPGVLFEVAGQTAGKVTDSRTNDFPDLLLGAPWLTANSVLIMDPSYQRMPDEDVEEIESKSDCLARIVCSRNTVMSGGSKKGTMTFGFNKPQHPSHGR